MLCYVIIILLLHIKTLWLPISVTPYKQTMCIKRMLSFKSRMWVMNRVFFNLQDFKIGLVDILRVN